MNKKLEKSGLSISQEIEKALEAPRKDGKIRITTMIDMAIYDALKSDAEAQKKGYQTILNDILLSHYFKPKQESDKTVWLNEIGKIKKRLQALEKEKRAV